MRSTVFVGILFSEKFNELTLEVLSFVKLCYEEKNFLIYRDFNIESGNGFQQGDPLATFGFCLVIHPFLISLNSELKTGDLDDVTLGDSRRLAPEDFLRFREEAEKLGLSLNERKCEVTAFGSNIHDVESTFSYHFPIIQCVPAE